MNDECVGVDEERDGNGYVRRGTRDRRPTEIFGMARRMMVLEMTWRMLGLMRGGPIEMAWRMLGMMISMTRRMIVTGMTWRILGLMRPMMMGMVIGMTRRMTLGMPEAQGFVVLVVTV